MRSGTVEDGLERGRVALEQGAWTTARATFEQILEREDAPEALEGLGQACWWLDDVGRVSEVRERAYLAYRRLGDARGAARVALTLAEDALVFRGEAAVCTGWTERSRRLLADVEPSPEHALLALHDAFVAFMLAADMEASRQHAGAAIDLTRRFGLFDLEMLARAIDGVARVAEGDVAAGMRVLDEATAAATSGEMRDVAIIGETCCWMIYGCERVRDFPRATQWCERVRDFTERHRLGSLLGVCRNHYAMTLALAGEWHDAEAELAGAAEQLASRPAQAAEGVARLAELRRRQGQHDDAAQLLEEVAFLPEAQIWQGLLALDRGEHAVAADVAERLLRQLPTSDRLQRVDAHEILVQARAALGDLDAARAALTEVEAVARDVATGPMEAAAALAGGVVAAASREQDRARALFEDAVALYTRSRLPYEAAEARLRLADVLGSLGEHRRAETEAQRAADTFARLGAAHGEQVAASRGSADETASDGVLTRRELEVLTLVSEGLGDRAIAERLTISQHTVHRHVSNIFVKLGVSSRAAATAHAAKRGLL